MAAREEKRSVITLYMDIRDYTETLSDAQMGQLMRAVLDYRGEQTLYEGEDPVVGVLFRVVKGEMDRYAAYQESRAESSRRSAKSRWEKERPAESDIPAEESPAREEAPEQTADAPEEQAAPAAAEPSEESLRSIAEEMGISREETRQFLDYYAARGWTLPDGRPIRDRRAALRLWHSRQKRYDAAAGPGKKKSAGSGETPAFVMGPEELRAARRLRERGPGICSA